MSNNVDLIRAIAETLEPENLDWVTFSLVVRLDEEGVPVQHYGYAFDHSGRPTAVVADDFVFEKPLLAYLNQKYPDGKFPVKMLIQFDRNTGRFNIEFEDKDPARWQVTPANIDRIREELRPKLD